MFDKATDCLCPLSVQRWDGNMDVVKESFQLYKLQVTRRKIEGMDVGGSEKRQRNAAQIVSQNL